MECYDPLRRLAYDPSPPVDMQRSMVEEFYTLTEKDRRAMIQANMESLVLRASGEKGEGWVLSFEMGVTKVSTDDDDGQDSSDDDGGGVYLGESSDEDEDDEDLEL